MNQSPTQSILKKRATISTKTDRCLAEKRFHLNEEIKREINSYLNLVKNSLQF